MQPIVLAEPYGLQTFLCSVGNLIGSRFVQHSEDAISRYARSCSATSQRSLAILQPSCTSQVQSIVQLAGQHAIKLYPISRGCNWGLGDACPTSENQVILDLRRMDRITTANAKLGAFTVEPGVTQQAMYEYLQDHELRFWYDASGAGPDASLLGNLMERGFGHTPLGDRFQNSCNYEVVLPDGSLVRTGFGQMENCATQDLFKPGIGPTLDGMFTQSNLGIVTRATFWMMPIPEHFEAFAFQLDSDSQLEQAVSALQPLRAMGIIASTLHIGNDFRVLSSKTQFPYDRLDGLCPFPEALRASLRKMYGVSLWNGLGAYYGTKRGAQSFRHDLRRALKGIVKPIFLTDRKLSLGRIFANRFKFIPQVSALLSKLDSAESVMELLKGKPVVEHLSGAAWRSRIIWSPNQPSPVDRADGILWFTPVVPCTAEHVRKLNQIISNVFSGTACEPLVTYVMASSRVMICPITICFDQSCGQQSTSAKELLSSLKNRCLEEGYYPYRESRAARVAGISSKLHLSLKQTIDPSEILAPGRYGN